ncbi:26S proteasome non-ATPase regulatory subunit 10 [Quillaja saponaria]|uniref:26S proteasome non-ATPase regulatory subunit 10 n=1 Tax=Quillaja saponaria TaxID=32244 RepID=A0AAD7KPR5_QUISA|nr:26S proteasome non-ATPase regulatory subunit 10 [Quillaja saponaria]
MVGFFLSSSALNYALSKGWLKIAEILILRCAKINIKNKVGCTCTPLHWAASNGNSELCELLIEEAAKVDVVDRSGQTQR